MPEDRVLTVEVRRRSFEDEELTTPGVGTAVRHAEATRAVVLEIGMKFIREGIPGAAEAGTGGIAGLNHEVGDDTVKDQTIVVGNPRDEVAGGWIDV